MLSVALKLEAALKGYIAANYQSSGMEFQGVDIRLGVTPEVNDSASCLVISAGVVGGPHARQGNYEIPVSFMVKTSLAKAAGNETETALRLLHGQRVEAIHGIFAESRIATVVAALAALDAELGVSAYWQDVGDSTFEGDRVETTIVRVFEAFLAP